MKGIDKMTDEVFFYCSTESFMKIIENKSLFMSDLHYMNDGQEELAFLEPMSEALIEIFNNLSTELKNAILRKDDDYVTYAYRYFHESKKLFTGAGFILCLSDKNDDLSQWRGYANDGNGICIGFDRNIFESINASKKTNIKTFGNTQKLIFGKIEYESKDKILSIIYENINPIVNEFLSNKKEFNRDELDKFVKKVYNDILSTKAFYKNPSFECEGEYRLCFYDTITLGSYMGNFFEDEYLKRNMHMSYDIKYNDVNLAELLSVKYICCNNKLIPYRELKFNTFSNLVTSVVLGPKNVMTKEAVQMFLINNDIEINLKNIKKSESSYQ